MYVQGWRCYFRVVRRSHMNLLMPAKLARGSVRCVHTNCGVEYYTIYFLSAWLILAGKDCAQTLSGSQNICLSSLLNFPHIVDFLHILSCNFVLQVC